jgi:hypothetical protein
MSGEIPYFVLQLEGQLGKDGEGVRTMGFCNATRASQARHCKELRKID